MTITRRKLAAAVLTSAAAPLVSQAVAQTAAQTPTNPDDELKAARDRLKTNIDTLARQTVPMDTEPAFQFKA